MLRVRANQEIFYETMFPLQWILKDKDIRTTERRLRIVILVVVFNDCLESESEGCRSKAANCPFSLLGKSRRSFC